MKYFDRITSLARKKNSSFSRLSTILNSLTVVFLLVFGQTRPHVILDFANFTLKSQTFTKKNEVKLEVKQPKPLATTYPQSTSTSSSSPTKPTANVPAKTAAQVSRPTQISQDHISISGRNIEIFRSSNTNINAGTSVGLYGSGFLYGHNTPAVFGSLGSVQTFSVTLGGTTKNYSVASRITLPKTCAESTECAEKYMGAFANKSYRGKYYDLILMTCAGTPTTPGDATHRLIVFANEI